jgi:hypothetical protein
VPNLNACVNPRKIIHELPRRDRAQIVHRLFKVQRIIRHVENDRRVLSRIGIVETEREPIEARDEFVDDRRRHGPAIIDCQVTRRAIRIYEIRNPGKLLQSAVYVVAECTLRAMGPADVNRMTVIEVVIDLRGEVVLAFRLRRHETEATDV